MNNLEWYKDELVKDIAEEGLCVISTKYMNFDCPLSCNREDCVRDSLDWLLKEHVSHDKPPLGEHPDPNKVHEHKTLDAKPVESIGCYKTEKMNGGTAFFTKHDPNTTIGDIMKSNTWVATDCDAGTVLRSPDKFLESAFCVKKIIVNGPATIIFWEDGSKTVSVCDKDDKFDIEKGIGMCFMKKALGGSYTNVIDTLSRVANPNNGYLSNDYINQINMYLKSDADIIDWLFSFFNMMTPQSATSDTPKNDVRPKVETENSHDTNTEK